MKPEDVVSEIHSVVCVFSAGGANYTYLTSLHFEIGDEALVVGYDGRSVVTVVEFNKNPRLVEVGAFPISYEWIAGKIDAEPYRDLAAMDVEHIRAQSFMSRLKK
jgi:hypothetical protein